VAWWFTRKLAAAEVSEKPAMPPVHFWGICGGVFLVAGILLFTWFGQDWGALNDLVRIAPMAEQRASGQGHAKPFWYFAELLAGGASGWAALGLAALGVKLQFGSANASRPWRWLGIYALLILAIYSAIPYKTPWLALNFWLPLALFFGAGVATLLTTFSRSRLRYLVWVVLAGAALGFARDDRNRVFRDPAGETNPYAYAHTTEDILDLPGRIAEVARAQRWAQPRIAVVAADAWPLPWYLRQFAQTGFWQPEQDPGPADLYVTTATPPATLQPRLKSFVPEFYGVRPNVLLILWTPLPSPAR
jgi:predicted membrane-bound mannosyltransferase